MIEILILYQISKKVLTMYGISREIKSEFSVLLTPSYGTISPALRRLEKDFCIKSQKIMSEGGRPSVYYSITKDGEQKLKELILQEPLENPIQFLPSARAKLVCSIVLNNSEKKELFNILKIKSESIIIDIKKLLQHNETDFYKKMVYDNLLCEYKNFVSLLEGFERACKN